MSQIEGPYPDPPAARISPLLHHELDDSIYVLLGEAIIRWSETDMVITQAADALGVGQVDEGSDAERRKARLQRILRYAETSGHPRAEEIAELQARLWKCFDQWFGERNLIAHGVSTTSNDRPALRLSPDRGKHLLLTDAQRVLDRARYAQNLALRLFSACTSARGFEIVDELPAPD